MQAVSACFAVLPCARKRWSRYWNPSPRHGHQSSAARFDDLALSASTLYGARICFFIAASPARVESNKAEAQPPELEMIHSRLVALQ